MTYGTHIKKAVDDYIEMEKSHAIITALRRGAITAIARADDLCWRVDTPITFFHSTTLEEAVKKALDVR